MCLEMGPSLCSMYIPLVSEASVFNSFTADANWFNSLCNFSISWSLAMMIEAVAGLSSLFSQCSEKIEKLL